MSLWNKRQDIEKDREYREAIADYMLRDKAKELRSRN